MNDSIMKSIVQDFITIMPLFQKKLFRQECVIKSGNLTFAHFQILMSLRENGGSSMTELAKRLVISNPNMTTLVDKLIKKKMVERIQNDVDRRITKIIMTDAGEKYLDFQLLFISSNLIDRLSPLSDVVIEKLSASLENLKEILLMIGTEN